MKKLKSICKIPVFSDDSEIRKQQFKQLHDKQMQFGINNGWWEEFDHKGPIRVWYISIEQFNNWPSVLVNCGLFASKSEARKNGHNKPLEIGTFLLFKGREKFIIF